MGGLIQADELSPFERQELEARFGYDGTSPVPSDLAERLGEDLLEPISEAKRKEAFAAAVAEAAESLPEEFSPPTEDLKIPEVQPMSEDAFERIKSQFDRAVGQTERGGTSTSPKQQPAPQPPPADAKAKFDAALAASAEEASDAAKHRDLHPDILKAASELEDGSYQQVKLDKEEKTDKQIAADQMRQRIRQQREAAIEATTEKERADFRSAMITMSLYRKTYDLFGGAVRVTFRDLGADEDELVLQQQTLDRLKGRVNFKDVAQVIHNARQYQFAAQLEKVLIPETGEVPVEIPSSQGVSEFLKRTLRGRDLDIDEVDEDDTVLRKWYRFLVSVALKSSTRSVLIQTFNDFERTVSNLRALASDPDFTDPTR